MQAIANYLRRFFFVLGDTLAMPFLVLRGLWRDSGRGRTLLFGLPAVIVFLIATGMVLVAMGSHDRLLKSYQLAQQRALDENRTAEAINYTYKLMQLKPTDDKLKFELAKLLINDTSDETGAQNRQRAMALFSALAPDDKAGLPEAHVRRAEILWKQTHLDARERLNLVERQLELALLGDPLHTDARTMRAEVFVLRRDLEPALEIYVDLFRDNVAHYARIVEILRALGRAREAPDWIRQAISRYDEMLRNDPDDHKVAISLAMARTQLGEFDEARSLLESKLESVTGDTPRRELSDALSRVHIVRARQYQKDLATDPESRAAFLSELAAAFRLDPANDVAKTLLTEFSLTDYPEAPEALGIYNPRDDMDNAPDQALYLLGTRELLNGDPAEGVTLLEKGLQRNPANHMILNNLAFALMDTDVDRAFGLINRAIELNPETPNYRDTRGNIYMRMGDWQNAIRDLERALAGGMKDNVKLYENLARCYEQLGLVEGAANYRRMIEELKDGQ